MSLSQLTAVPSFASSIPVGSTSTLTATPSAAVNGLDVPNQETHGLSQTDPMRLTLAVIVLKDWKRAETASHRRHAARRAGDFRAACRFSDEKIQAILRAVTLAPYWFRTRVHFIDGHRLRSVLCRLNGRCLHLPMWVKLPAGTA